MVSKILAGRWIIHLLKLFYYSKLYVWIKTFRSIDLREKNSGSLGFKGLKKMYPYYYYFGCFFLNVKHFQICAQIRAQIHQLFNIIWNK